MLPDTLESTVELLDDGTSFVFTGDIPAMWLRDSSAQVRPYLRFAATNPGVRRVIAGLIRRQAQALLIDPYANAFNRTPDGQGRATDHTEMGRGCGSASSSWTRSATRCSSWPTAVVEQINQLIAAD